MPHGILRAWCKSTAETVGSVGSVGSAGSAGVVGLVTQGIDSYLFRSHRNGYFLDNIAEQHSWDCSKHQTRMAPSPKEMEATVEMVAMVAMEMVATVAMAAREAQEKVHHTWLVGDPGQLSLSQLSS